MDKAKPVMVVTVDGSQDINPLYTKTIACAIDYFVTQDWNALFLATNATGSRATNGKVQQMVGRILPHNHLGSHLNTKREGTDIQLKIRKFSHTGEILAETWSGVIIDGYPVLVKYISECNADDVTTKSQEWKAVHEQES